ncbi:hypothetical protein Tco_1206361 [Tanacetum coccineum]
MVCVSCESRKPHKAILTLRLPCIILSHGWGASGCVISKWEGVIGSMGCGKWVWGTGKCTREVVWPCKPWGEAVWVLAGKGFGYSLWLQDRAFKVFTVFVVILLGFPGPSDGLRLHPIVFFSSGSGLTADSSVLTLTLAFLDFGLDSAQSFPFHAQFCHFGLAAAFSSSAASSPAAAMASMRGVKGIG